ncbi:MAG: tRNA adenosine(34) deaminase TadA [Candidatus Binataceae bacterium]
MSFGDELKFMAFALAEARQGAMRGEVPVGAVVVAQGKVISAAHNRPISLNDPSAHAEVLALREAARRRKSYRLDDVTLYVTLEPCVMCVGAALQARVAAVRYGARDEKAGALGSVYDIGRDGLLNHRFEVQGGLLQDECAELLQKFFAQRRE